MEDYISGQTETRVYRGTIRMGMASINLIVMSSDAERKTLKYTLCGDYVYACGKGGESIFLLICLPRLPRGASLRGGCEIWIKVSGRVTLPGSNSPAAFYNCVLSLNMYRFAPRACSPGFGRPPLRPSPAPYIPGPIIEPRERLPKTYVLKIARRGIDISWPLSFFPESLTAIPRVRRTVNHSKIEGLEGSNFLSRVIDTTNLNILSYVTRLLDLSKLRRQEIDGRWSWSPWLLGGWIVVGIILCYMVAIILI